MTAVEAVRRAAATMLGGAVESVVSLSGGCQHDVYGVVTSHGTAVMKVVAIVDRAMVEGELSGLEAMAETGTVRVPQVLGLEIGDEHVVLGMEWLQSAGRSVVDWDRFGTDLASMHASAGEDRYGFPMHNHIGRTSQCNIWCTDWVEFTATCRLLPQLSMARDAGHLESVDAGRIEDIIQRLDQFIPRHPDASLLHGDLWSGNVIPLEDGTVAVIDPSCSYGDAWCDLAMMRLFGGFPDACEAAWRSHQSEDDTVGRIAIYQLYHQLNHLNLFGSAYLGGVRDTISRLE